MSADAERRDPLDVVLDVGAHIFAEIIDEGDVALTKIAEIEAILDDMIAKLPTTDPAVPWNALAEIRKVLR